MQQEEPAAAKDEVPAAAQPDKESYTQDFTQNQSSN